MTATWGGNLWAASDKLDMVSSRHGAGSYVGCSKPAIGNQLESPYPAVCHHYQGLLIHAV